MGKVPRNPTAKITVRYAIPLLVSLMSGVGFVACDSGNDETVSSVPLEERFLTAADAPGSNPDPIETRQTAVDLGDSFVIFSPALIDPDKEEVTTVLQDAGFKWMAVDVRFFGETHKDHAPHLFGTIIELESEDGARSVLDWFEADAMKPCPQSCAARVSSFDVDDIPDARGVHRIATAQDIENSGGPDEQPTDGYWVGFTEGSIVYAMELQGLPGSSGSSVSEEQAKTIASAYYDRLAAI